MKVSELRAALTNEFKKYFPLGLVVVKPTKILGNPFLSIRFFSEDKDHAISHIVENSYFLAAFTINDFYVNIDDLDGELKERLTIEVLKKPSLSCEPENQYFAMSHKYISYRKRTTSPEKIQKSLIDMIHKARELWIDSRENGTILRGHKESDSIINSVK